MDALLATDYALVGADYLQTRQIAMSCHSGGEFYETDPLLGHCPSMARVNAYFAGYGLVMQQLAAHLHGAYRTAFLISIGAREGTLVRKNILLGVKIGF